MSHLRRLCPHKLVFTWQKSVEDVWTRLLFSGKANCMKIQGSPRTVQPQALRINFKKWKMIFCACVWLDVFFLFCQNSRAAWVSYCCVRNEGHSRGVSPASKTAAPRHHLFNLLAALHPYAQHRGWNCRFIKWVDLLCAAGMDDCICFSWHWFYQVVFLVEATSPCKPKLDIQDSIYQRCCVF